MIQLAELLVKSEDRLMSILHQYTIGTGYSKYSSTLEEAWRMSVSTLSNLLIKTCTNLIESIELGPDIEVKQLSGLLPICSYCKKIRDDKGYWNQIESYIHEHSAVKFSHGICQECAKIHYPEMDLYDE
jgi:hypothetical protein